MSREISLEEYKKWSKEFNQLSFEDKIKTIKENSDLLFLACDYNWWFVKVKDKQIQEQLEDSEQNFYIGNEWSWEQMIHLLNLLGIPVKGI